MDARLAGLEDFRLRYGEPEDEPRVQALLADASALMLSEYEAHWGEPYLPGLHPEFERAATAVCCRVVASALSVPDGMAGATQYSQGAGSYTASVTFGSALGSMWLSKSDRRALGLVGTTVRSMRPAVRGCHGLPDQG